MRLYFRDLQAKVDLKFPARKEMLSLHLIFLVFRRQEEADITLIPLFLRPSVFGEKEHYNVIGFSLKSGFGVGQVWILSQK